jgi:hypothetical protein
MESRSLSRPRPMSISGPLPASLTGTFSTLLQAF